MTNDEEELKVAVLAAKEVAVEGNAAETERVAAAGSSADHVDANDAKPGAKATHDLESENSDDENYVDFMKYISSTDGDDEDPTPPKLMAQEIPQLEEGKAQAERTAEDESSLFRLTEGIVDTVANAPPSPIATGNQPKMNIPENLSGKESANCNIKGESLTGENEDSAESSEQKMPKEADKDAAAPTGSLENDAKDVPVKAEENIMHPNMDITGGDGKENSVLPQPAEPQQADPHLDREILFDDSVINIQVFDGELAEGDQKVQGFTNQQWIAAADKKMIFIAPVLRVMPGRYFWSSDVFAKRILAIYSQPNIILIMRLPKDLDEVRHLLPIRGGLELSENELHAFLVVESVADPATCKIRLSQLTNATSVPSKDMMQSSSVPGLKNSPKGKNVPRGRSCFDILTPTEVATLSAAFIPDEFYDDIEYTSEKSLSDTHRCEDAISSALINANPLNDSQNSGTDEVWKHQVVLGTLQSYVISGNDQLLKEALENALRIQRSLDETESSNMNKVDCIDARDVSGKTALYYACSRRRNSALQMLINAGADCSLTLGEEESTPCHICSKALNETALSIVLSANHPTRPNPNALDIHGRTPMYVAAVEGQSTDGKTNAIALDLCLSALEAWGGQWMVDSPKICELLHPVHILSTQWKTEELSVILSHCNYKYPLTSTGGSDPSGISLTAHYHYPIHAALLSFRRKIISNFAEYSNDNEFNVEFMPLEPALVKTLRTLMQYGFEPNERFEGISGEGEAIRSISCYFGFTPLQVLALAAAEARAIHLKKEDSAKDGVETTRILKNIMKVVQASAEFLVKTGARINILAPPSTRLDRAIPSGCYSLEEALEGEQDSSMNFAYRGKLKIDGNDELLSLLGGAGRINTCQNAFATEGKSVENTGDLTVASSSLNSGAPGGSDSYSCAICWSEFGVISNRKHLCRVSCRYVCNDCSKKRLVTDGSELRLSDGQFLLAVAEARKVNAKAGADRKEKMQIQRTSVTQARKSLGLSSASTGSASSSDTDTRANLSTKERITSAISGLSQTKNAVLERGDKLENLADKTEALNNASLDFANMAKELNRSQNSWW